MPSAPRPCKSTEAAGLRAAGLRVRSPCARQTFALLPRAMFYLVPPPKLDRPRRGSPRMFSIDWVEKYLSRVRPWHVIVIWTPFTAWLLVKGARDPSVSAVALAGFFVLGI